MSTYSSPGTVTNGSEANHDVLSGADSTVPGSIQPDASAGQTAIEDGAGVFIKPPFQTQPQDVDANTFNLLVREEPQENMKELTVRDGEFYIESADCVIRVDNTLFRVHRYILSRDSSAFQYMFSMPTANHIPSHVEGLSDDNPILLHGESVERFRALLSVLYDLPPQLQKYNTSEADVDRLLTVVEMTDKYHFASIETWAADALYNVVSGLHGTPRPQYELGRCTSVWMKRLLEVAILSGHTVLRDYIAEQWASRIAIGDLSPAHALEIADRAGIRKLQGYAYYAQLLAMGDDFLPGATDVAELDGTLPSLTHEQRVRLLLGHWSLSRYWDKLRTNPPQVPQAYGCISHQQGCVTTWTQVWRDVGKSEATLKHPAADVLGRLRSMEQQMFGDPGMHVYLARAMAHCKRSAVVALKATIKEVREGLADHFPYQTGTGPAEDASCA